MFKSKFVMIVMRNLKKKKSQLQGDDSIFIIN